MDVLSTVSSVIDLCLMIKTRIDDMARADVSGCLPAAYLKIAIFDCWVRAGLLQTHQESGGTLEVLPSA